MRGATPTVLALLLAAGCLGTPQPDPPNAAPVVDPDRLYTDRANYGGITVLGQPGAVWPAEAILRFWDLETADPAHDVAPNPDGSFAAEVPGAYGDEQRLHAILDGAWSAPVDVVVVDEDTLVAAPRPRAACLVTSPEWGLVADGPGAIEVELRNECAEAVVVADVRVRLPSTPFVVAAFPASVAAGGVGRVRVEYAGGGGEDILLIELGGVERERRAVTLVGGDR
jgi:hypothetical protein